MNQRAALTSAIEALRRDDAQVALQCCDSVLAQRPGDIDALHLRGLALHRLGDNHAAIATITEAVQRAPRNAVLHGNLGRVWAALGNMEKAAHCFGAAVGLAPNSSADHADLANALIRLGRTNEGCAALERAFELTPVNPVVLEALYSARMIQAKEAAPRNQHQQAVAAYDRALELKPNDPKALHGRAAALLAMGDSIKALSDARAVVAIVPQNSEALMLLGEIEQNCGNTADAAATFEKMMAIDARDLRAKWCRAILLPSVYDSEEQIENERTAWRERVTALAADLKLDTPEAVASSVEGLYSANNYNLHYQGRNDRPLQELYGGLLHRIATARYPQFAAQPASMRGERRRPRIGFISQYLREHSVWKIQGAWIMRTSSNIEKYVYYTGTAGDQYTETLRAAADVFVHEPDMHRLIATIAAHRLDVLVYLDHGMSYRMQLPAALWLAPVQCNGLCHPITSGLPTMSHALSSTLMEPPNGQDHYSEALVRLPNSAYCFSLSRIQSILAGLDRPPAAPDRIRFLCSQNLQKYLPQFDHVFADIAAELPQAEFHFIGPRKFTTGFFANRLRRSFAKRQLDADRFCVFHPRLSAQDYMRLNLLCDIFLDSIHWSGNNTAHEAAACGLPIVTMPGPMMRGRHCLALLTMMGLTETVATDLDDYIRLAVRLGSDSDWRAHLRAETLKRRDRLFDDETPVRELERFLVEVSTN